MTACELCDLSPAEGDSTVTDPFGVAHQLCHPVTGSGPRPLSCFEILGYVLVENNPYGRRPPEVIPLQRRARAREILAVMVSGPAGGAV